MRMEMEDRRSHGVRADKVSEQWANVLAEARERRSADTKRRQDKATANMEERNQKKKAKRTRQIEAAKERDETKAIKETKKVHIHMLQELRHAHKSTRQER
jgi:hypothetical protein